MLTMELSSQPYTLRENLASFELVMVVVVVRVVVVVLVWRPMRPLALPAMPIS